MNTNFEGLKQEYDYWKQTIENLENKMQKRDEEWWRLNFAKGFVSAIDKVGVFDNPFGDPQNLTSICLKCGIDLGKCICNK